MNITRGKKQEAQKIVLYGPEGIGKSTFAAQFPQPLFIDTEGSTSNMDVARMDPPSSFTMLMEEIRYVREHPQVCQTLVIDTADWAEQLCIAEFCAKKQIAGIEDIGYGKGYVYVAEDFGRMLNLLEEVKKRGIHIVVTAHAQMRKFEQPDEMGAYDRWELKLQKKDAPMLKEWADMVLFANYKTVVVNVDNQGAAKGKNKAQGGKRVMYTQHHPCWDAKNRHGLPQEVSFTYASVAHCIPEMACAGQISGTAPAPAAAVPRQAEPEGGSRGPGDMAQPAGMATGGTGAVPDAGKAPATNPAATQGIPKKLLDLMDANRVTVDDVTAAVEKRGYYPKGTPIANYDPAFVEGVLVAAWPKVYEMIKENRQTAGEFINIPDGTADELPFN
ncbi:MAG: ATP-binding protein [Lachnospiraceae bacterium]|nr:ATP-binding protein [Lachnospiraceae bacterium]